MITITGKYTEAVVHADEVELNALKQIRQVCGHPAFEGCRSRIMPDVHAGAGCVIGFTAEMKNGKVIPNLIGVDIGCGVLTARLPDVPDFHKFDAGLRERVPSGMNVRASMHPLLAADEELRGDVERICRDLLQQNAAYHLNSVGSLGGGNHFIEIDRGRHGAYVCIHSGSRNFGWQIARRYQMLAEATCPDDSLTKPLRYLEGEAMLDYMRDMRVAQRFAALNRRVILAELAPEAYGNFDTVHNYIDERDVIRKGAVDASAGKTLIVPLNMRDGAVICEGLGNEDYNCSSPHGAGRIMSRSQAQGNLSLEMFREAMEGIFSTCISQSTLDEAPMAYKPKEFILASLAKTARIVDHIKPLYNFKAA